MARKADRRPNEIRIGGPESAMPIEEFKQFWNAARSDQDRELTAQETSQREHLRLTGVPINGVAPLIANGDPVTRVGHVKCKSCSTVVAEILVANELDVIELQIIDDPSVHPAITRPTRRLLIEGAELAGDCPGHGSRVVNVADVLTGVKRRRRGKFLTFWF